MPALKIPFFKLMSDQSMLFVFYAAVDILIVFYYLLLLP